MKPDFLAERMARPAGRALSSSVSTLSSSSSKSADSVLALAPSRSNSTGNEIATSLRKRATRSGDSPTLTARTARRPSPSFVRSRSSEGISSRHGSHHVAQKFTTTVLPFHSPSLRSSPSASASTSTGVFPPGHLTSAGAPNGRYSQELFPRATLSTERRDGVNPRQRSERGSWSRALRLRSESGRDRQVVIRQG